MRARVAVPLVIFLLIGQIGVVNNIAIGESESNANSIPSSIAIEDIIEDPYFEVEPTTVVNGTSGEFSTSHHQAVDEEDFNYMELAWTHVANTSLDFRIGEDENLPDCLEFIYLYQDFDWPFNEMPLDAELQINMSATLTGSFATEQYGNLMFRVYAWMIDSSGNWIQVYESRDAVYSEIYQERRVNFNYFDLSDTWGGMIENSTGFQEDPDDTVQVAIGLAPIDNFETFHAYEDDPWEFYDGSVNVRIKSMELWVYMDEEPDPSQVLLPRYNNTWEYSVREVFPDVPEEFENSTEQFRNLVTDTDGSVYVLCDIGSSYEYRVEEGRYYSSQFLLRYTPQLELLWAKPLGNMTRGYAVTVHDGYIYTTGYIYTDDQYHNLIVTKWSSNGDIIWQTEWGGIYAEDGSAIAVSSDGSIYVWAAYYNNRFEPDFWRSSFLKLDSSGTLLWNKTSEIPLMPGRAELEMRPGGMYSWDSAYVEKRNLTCELVWNISRLAFAANFDDSGNIYIATMGYWEGPGALSDEWQVMISKWNPSGAELWNTNYSIPLPDGSYLNFQCRSIDVAPDGSILAILHEMELSYDYHMLKLDSSGSLLWDKIIGDERWPVYGGPEPKLHIGDNGLAYVGFNRYGDYGIEVAVSVFVVGPYNLGSNLQTMIIVGISVAALAAVVIVVYIRKYR